MVLFWKKMPVLEIWITFLVLIAFSVQTPFIFEETFKICSYSVGEGDKTNIGSDIWTVRFGELQIDYKLCGTFTDNSICPVGSAACLSNQKAGSKILLGTEFSLASEKKFQSLQGERCAKDKNYTIIVSLFCFDQSEDVYLVPSDDKCTYQVTMRDPKCPPKCAAYINGKYIDLRDLQKTSFSVKSDERNFSLTLCGKNPVCKQDDVNACEIKENQKTPLSLASTVSVSYVGEKNQLTFQGHTYKFVRDDIKKTDKRVEVILKCDWDKQDINKYELKYVKKPTQGHKYTFELETSFGCIKKPISCVVKDGFLFYNLTELYDQHRDMWSTKQDNSTYFLQVCGSMEMAGKNTSCKSTYAQVCENTKDGDINRGSVLRHLEIVNDALQATIESGMQCKEKPGVQYRTLINFVCEIEENGPKFVKQEQCDTYFNWKTPHACPRYNVSSCSHIHENNGSCFFQKDRNFYNLTELSATQLSIENETKVFLFNICGSVHDIDAPCMKDVQLALKDLQEFNPKHKILSLGKFSRAAIEDGNLVLKYTTGSYCNGTDYTSQIRFECSTEKETPRIIKSEECFYEFLWKTKLACPVPAPCSYNDHYTNKSIDFSVLQKTTIDIDGRYTFDICQKNYTKCGLNGDGCKYGLYEKSEVRNFRNFTSLEFTLPGECQTGQDFNKVNFRMICEEIENNEHIKKPEIINCTAVIDYFTHIICDRRNDEYTMYNDYPDSKTANLPKENVYQVLKTANLPKENEYHVPKTANLTRENPVQKNVECLAESPFTHVKLNVTNLTLNNDFSRKECPSVTFNDTFRYIKLVYTTTDRCRYTTAKNQSYEVFLKCVDYELVPSGNDECVLHSSYVRPESCNSFKPKPSPQGMTIGSIIGIIIGIILISVVVCIAIYYIMQRRRLLGASRDYGFLYVKDTEL